ncbi:MAG: prolyl oligopeptidase family serine peptidase [Hyphomonadaceae bacterium]|nr:prolyl oligopeptidase family serine peptidase [Hyphomonadaceae bacterium]
MTGRPTLFGALAALVILAVALLAPTVLAQALPSGKQMPAISFTTPDGADTHGDPYEWMLQPAFRKDLNKQMLRLTRVQDGPLRASSSFWPARAAIERYFEMGPNYAYVALLNDQALYLSYGRLFLTGRPGVFYDPIHHTPFAAPSLEGFSLSPDGRTLAVSVGDGGTEIAVVQFIDMKTGMVLEAEAGPIVVGGDMGFTWLTSQTGVFRKAATTSLVEGDPSVGAEWTLFDIASGTAGASVFGENAPGVETEFGDWFGFWVPAQSDRAMGYLWRGNFIDAYTTDLASLQAGTPTWQEIGSHFQLSDVEIYNNHYIMTAASGPGQSGLYALPVSGGHVRQVARAGRDVSYLYTISLGEIAYVAARKGDMHSLFRMTGDDLALEEVDLPFEGEIDFDSFFPVEGSETSVTFDMSSPGQPWQLLRLDAEGAAYAVNLPGLSRKDDLSDLAAVEHSTVFARSRDGTEVPLSITAPASQAGMPAPTIIHAYGSYGETTMAGWDPAALAWVSLGGVQAECHVRGSGYYGPSWHADGSGPDKRRSHEDMIACGEKLVQLGYSEPGQIAALGGSAGGLIAAPVALKRPDLFGAAIVEFGVVNPLRSLDGPNGATQIDEFGDPRIPEDAVLMAASDSVELARTAETLPDMFLCVGFQDSRVPHWMSARLAAVMAERGAGDQVVIHADADAGHSCGFYTEDQRDALAKQFAWLLDRFEE